MEQVNLALLLILLVLVLFMLWWQKKQWDASDAGRYYSKHPPDWISFRVVYRDETPQWFKDQLSLFVYRVSDIWDISGGGVGGPVEEKFHFEGMSMKQAECMEDVIKMYCEAAGHVAFVEHWVGFDTEEDKG